MLYAHTIYPYAKYFPLSQIKKIYIYIHMTIFHFFLNVSQGRNYSATSKVFIDKNTTVICQGLTGKQV